MSKTRQGDWPGEGDGHERRRPPPSKTLVVDDGTDSPDTQLSQAPEEHREALPSGAGVGKTLLLDTFSGIAGDMTIAALVDLGVPLQVVSDAVQALGLDGVRLDLRPTRAGAVGALKFDVFVESQQSDRTYHKIDHLLQQSRLDPRVAELARRIFRRLGEAEARVHRVPLEDVHFHEVGAADAIVDIVGAAACFVHLGAEVLSTPLPMGRGSVGCRHGQLPLPAPATVGCLQGVPTYDAGIDAELVTPTGAAIVATVAADFVRWPSFIPERIGWGAGSRALSDRPNALRVVLGSTHWDRAQEPTSSHVVVEANVDDLTGELAAHAMGALLAAGALDAWAVPTTMKKGRPGLVLAAVAERQIADAVAEVMLRETSTIGVRRLPVDRTERPRRILQVQTRFGSIPVKSSEGPYGPAQLKPEFDACVQAAKAHGVPVREVIAEALSAARQRS